MERRQEQSCLQEHCYWIALASSIGGTNGLLTRIYLTPCTEPGRMVSPSPSQPCVEGQQNYLCCPSTTAHLSGYCHLCEHIQQVMYDPGVQEHRHDEPGQHRQWKSGRAIYRQGNTTDRNHWLGSSSWNPPNPHMVSREHTSVTGFAVSLRPRAVSSVLGCCNEDKDSIHANSVVRGIESTSFMHAGNRAPTLMRAL